MKIRQPLECAAYRVHVPRWAYAPTSGDGAGGILFPSMINPGATNLVLYTEALKEGDRLMAYDPAGDLPKDQRSWE